ncbi:MAG: RNA polymerase sigma factor [Myxococcota bacterium]
MARSKTSDAQAQQERPSEEPPQPTLGTSELSLSLFQAVLRDERGAVDRFILQVTPRVRRVAHRICGPIDGEDAVQSSLLMIARGVKEVREPAALAFWIDRVVVQTSLSCIRRERRRGALLRRWGLPGQLPWGQETESTLSETLGMDRLLRPLPLAERRLLVMRYVLEFSAAEIAELTSTPEGTIRNRLRKSRRRLARSVQRSSLRSGDVAPLVSVERAA